MSSSRPRPYLSQRVLCWEYLSNAITGRIFNARHRHCLYQVSLALSLPLSALSLSLSLPLSLSLSLYCHCFCHIYVKSVSASRKNVHPHRPGWLPISTHFNLFSNGKKIKYMRVIYMCLPSCAKTIRTFFLHSFSLSVVERVYLGAKTVSCTVSHNMWAKMWATPIRTFILPLSLSLVERAQA